MCPPTSAARLSDISLYWTDEELFTCLDKLEQGFPLPGNVIADLNPYQYIPSNLPDGIWYYVRSEEKNDPEFGFWKAGGVSCEIFRNADITGWRTTHEFYEGQVPEGRRTDWMMQEYKITRKGLCGKSKPKESGSLCRVFLTGGQSSNDEHGDSTTAGGNHFLSMPSTVSTTESQVKNRDDETGPLAVAERLHDPPVENLPQLDSFISDDYLELDDLSEPKAERLPDPPVENLPEVDSFLSGDYLELNDFVDPESPSSSSDNSSDLSLTSEECFDALALLRDLENEDNQNLQRKDSNVKFSVSASVRPNEVVLTPSTLGSLVAGNTCKSPAEVHAPASSTETKNLDGRVVENAVGMQKADYRNNCSFSEPRNVASSSSSSKPGVEGEKKVPISRMRKLKKYFCFFPF